MQSPLSVMKPTHATTINLHNAIWTAPGVKLKRFLNSLEEDEIRWLLTSYLESFMMHRTALKKYCNVNDVRAQKLKNVSVKTIVH